ncbi:conserved hypothetical protein [Candidatus Desulfarcum epimagneticum]|uniref:Uncharacterized protein n=1 Tax=uncultured Desulfobacteraceae bacterium TaxID=218296 RepID=A0A484HMF2_9BACT|nr:conserved hypothetical protein [uncultured Desulfobacteraceae bacterium]
MILKDSVIGRRRFARFLSVAIKFKVIVFLSLFLIYSVALIGVSGIMYKYGFTSIIKDIGLGVIYKNYTTPFNYFKGLWSSPEKLIIDIKHKNFQKLAYEREVALAQRFLNKGEYVSATIRHGNKKIRVKMRLKGDNIDHLHGAKWSYRIKVKGDQTIFGMKIFSIQHPKTRNYIFEWIFHQALRREDILNLRYKFVNVIINGRDLGIYALEEHFEKRLVEYRRRREGPILRLEEDLSWHEGRVFPSKTRSGYGSYFSSAISSFNKNNLTDPKKYSTYQMAYNLFEGFRLGFLKPSEIFDIKRLATFLALADILGAEHALRTNNLRFYYNPVTSLFEPIGFDGDTGQVTKKLIGVSSGSLLSAGFERPVPGLINSILSDEIVFGEYIRQLERITEDLYLESLLSDLKEDFKKNMAIIYRDFPWSKSSMDVFFENREYIRNFLTPKKIMGAYFSKKSKDKITLFLGNVQRLPAEVVEVVYGNSYIFKPVEKVVFPGKIPGKPAIYMKVDFFIPEKIGWLDDMPEELRVRSRLLGSSMAKDDKIIPGPHFDPGFINNDFIRKPPNALSFDFLNVNEEKKTITFKSGEWTLARDLILPKGYMVLANEGLEINLINSAKILSYSALNFLGSEKKPIRFYSENSSGQGVLILKARKKSILKYVNFQNLGPPSQKGWALTGAVTFYESPVSINRCAFSASRAEDALNIIRSDFTISDSHFQENKSDAFDGDFVKGEILDSLFVSSGNDALDFSGSVVKVRNVFINRAGDKGMSFGEKTKAVISQANILNTEIAVAGKDLSEIDIDHIRLQNSKVGFSVYQKKSEFGPSTMKAFNLSMNKVALPYLLEKGSKLEIDGKEVEPYKGKIKDLLYGAKFGRKSGD